MESKDGIIWLATMGNGVWKCDPKTNFIRIILIKKEWTTL